MAILGHWKLTLGAGKTVVVRVSGLWQTSARGFRGE